MRTPEEVAREVWDEPTLAGAAAAIRAYGLAVCDWFAANAISIGHNGDVRGPYDPRDLADRLRREIEGGKP